MAHPPAPWLAFPPRQAWLDYLFPVILAAGLLITPWPVWAMIFYLTIPAFTLYRAASGWRFPLRDPAVVLGVALILWSTAAIAWGHDPSGMNASKLFWLGNGGSTLAFFAAWLMAAEKDKPRAWIEPALLIGGAGNALFAIGRHLLVDPANPRMWGWGLSGQPVLGGTIMAVLFVLALDRLLRRRKAVLLHLALMALFAVFILLSGSRGPLLAAAIATLYRLRDENWRIWLACAAAGLGCLALGLLFARRWLTEAAVSAATRGSDFHVTIWQAALALIKQHPLIGYGPTARLPLILPGLVNPFPHNLYLSLLLYSGAIGLALFLGLIVSLAWRAGWGHGGRVALCLVPLITGCSDLGSVIKGPAPIWYIVWVPVLLLITELRYPPAAAKAEKVFFL